MVFSRMRISTLSKALAASVVALSVMTVTAASVSGTIANTSANVASSPVEEALQSAPTAAPTKKVLSSLLKSRRPVTTKVAATLLKPAGEALLPAVKQKDIKEKHQKLANSVLRALPAPCRTNLKNFFVQYTDVKQRGLGGKTTIILDGTAPDAEFAALLIHECGHVTHANMHGTPAAGDSVYRDGNAQFYADSPVVQFFAISWLTEDIRHAGSSKQDFVSGYAQSNAFEDFAETFALYILHRPAMRERAKTNDAIAAKLAWMETYLPVQETAVGTSDYTWNKQVPWDVTKLPMTLAQR